jgi:amino acid transporter
MLGAPRLARDRPVGDSPSGRGGPIGRCRDPPLAEISQHLVGLSRSGVTTLGRFDMVFFTVAVIVGLDLIGQAASNVTEAITWVVILTALFLLPHGLVMAEVGSAFTAEGGPYEWVKLTMGRFWAGLNTIFYWVTNPLWIGGSLAFIGTEAWSSGISNIDSGSFWDYLFKFAFIWVSITSAIISFRVGKWIPTLGAILKVALVCVFAITGIGGFLDAVKESYTIYGGAASFLFGVTAVLFILTLMNSGASWMMCGDRVLAVSAADGGFFPYFGAFDKRLGTPLRANVLSGIMATAFMVAAVLLLSGGAADAFGVVLNIAISTTLISYILVFPSVYVLRRKFPDVRRPFRLGGAGSGLLLACAALITFWVTLGSWTAVFPGTLDRLFGLGYSFDENWGVSQGTFMLFTLGTLAAIVAIFLVGYRAAASVRSYTVPMTLGYDEPEVAARWTRDEERVAASTDQM